MFNEFKIEISLHELSDFDKDEESDAHKNDPPKQTVGETFFLVKDKWVVPM